VNNSKLTYFDFSGGRGEPIRMAMAMGGQTFEDERISFEQFGEMRPGLPLNAVPVLNVDGTVYTQTNAMLRYAGVKADLCPSDPWQGFLCDEVLDICEDVFHAMGKTLGLEGDELKAARDAMVMGPLTNALKLLSQRLEAAGGEFFSENKLTIADLKVFANTGMLLSGMFDHVPVDIVERLAPNLLAHMERVSSDARVAEYLKTLS